MCACAYISTHALTVSNELGLGVDGDGGGDVGGDW